MPSPDETRPVFIVSTGRCGSTMLSNMVRMHPRLLSVSEFFSALPHVADDPEALRDELASALRAHGRHRLTSHYRFVFEWLADRFGKSVWLKRSGGSLLLVPAYAEWVENASALPRPQPPRWTRLPPEERPRLAEACAPGQRILGYESGRLLHAGRSSGNDAP